MEKHGSGRTHGTVEDYRCLDSFSLQGWQDGNEGGIAHEGIHARLQGDKFTLAFPATDKWEIELSRIRNGFGGNPRTYFLCPCCGKRVRLLYLMEKGLRCRVCGRLNYLSQQMAHDERYRARVISKILCRDFGFTRQLSPDERQYYVPDKPKWMRWHTYRAKSIKLTHAQDQYIEAMTALAFRMLPRK